MVFTDYPVFRAMSAMLMPFQCIPLMSMTSTSLINGVSTSTGLALGPHLTRRGVELPFPLHQWSFSTGDLG